MTERLYCVNIYTSSIYVNIIQGGEEMREQRHGFRHRNAAASGGSSQTLIEACLLSLINKSDEYGYQLIKSLEDFGFTSISSGPVYRALRNLESRGYLASKWDTSSNSGSARRRYALTEDGRYYLGELLDSLGKTRDVIGNILKTHSAENETIT
ncbi:Transcriptional regulator PadR [Candidatus Magnetoovum chiemensis]|nr:Transcriptional regulator PadR [Candidatus Magnetoovum chiemensis]